MIFPEGSKICFIGSHPDDIELGCGAFLSSIAGKYEVLCITLSSNEKNPSHANLLDEHLNSLQLLGVPKDNILIGPFETRIFTRQRQQICDYLYKIKEDYNPDVIITHCFNDIHQDHQTIPKEVLRIFRKKTILGFEVARSNFKFAPNLFVEVQANDVDNKLRSLEKFKTHAHRDYFDPELIRAQARVYGQFIEKRYAEAFEVVRLVVPDSNGNN